MAKNKQTYADVVAKVDGHLYNAMYELTDDQRELLVVISSNLAHLKNALNGTADV